MAPRKNTDIDPQPSAAGPGTPLPILMSGRQLADYLGVSLRTVEGWRNRPGDSADSRGPNWIKVGGVVRYNQNDVLAWLERKGQHGAAA